MTVHYLQVDRPAQMVQAGINPHGNIWYEGWVALGGNGRFDELPRPFVDAQVRISPLVLDDGTIASTGNNPDAVLLL